jgi:hypothetical protein
MDGGAFLNPTGAAPMTARGHRAALGGIYDLHNGSVAALSSARHPAGGPGGGGGPLPSGRLAARRAAMEPSADAGVASSGVGAVGGASGAGGADGASSPGVDETTAWARASVAAQRVIATGAVGAQAAREMTVRTTRPLEHADAIESYLKSKWRAGAQWSIATAAPASVTLAAPAAWW